MVGNGWQWLELVGVGWQWLAMDADGSWRRRVIWISIYSPRSSHRNQVVLRKERSAQYLTNMAEVSLPHYDKCIIYVDNQSSM